LRPYLGALFPKRALLRRQRREASVRLKIADQGISALQSDLANGLNIIGHDGNNGQTYNRPTDAPVTAARDSGAVRLPVLGELKASGAPAQPWEPMPGWRNGKTASPVAAFVECRTGEGEIARRGQRRDVEWSWSGGAFAEAAMKAILTDIEDALAATVKGRAGH
jgi:hypothetical protein